MKKFLWLLTVLIVISLALVFAACNTGSIGTDPNDENKDDNKDKDPDWVIINDTSSAYPFTKDRIDPILAWSTGNNGDGGGFNVQYDFYHKIRNAPEGSIVRVYIDAGGLPVGTYLGWFNHPGAGIIFYVPEDGYIDLELDQIFEMSQTWGGIIDVSNSIPENPEITGIELRIPRSLYQPIVIMPQDLDSLMIPGAKAWPKYGVLVDVSGDVSWASGDPSIIATYEGIGDYGVPSGLTVVEALKEGDALVTIQSVNDPSVQGTMQITVHPAPVPPASATHKKSADLPLGGSLPGTWLPDAFGESVADAVNACGGDTVYVVFNLNGDGYNTGDTVATFGFGRAVFSITYPLKKTDDGRTALTGTQIMAVLNDDSLKLPAGALTTQIENCDKIISAELWIPN